MCESSWEKWKAAAGERPWKDNMQVLPTFIKDSCLNKCSGILQDLAIVQLSDRSFATKAYVDFKLTQFSLAKGSLRSSLNAMHKV